MMEYDLSTFLPILPGITALLSLGLGIFVFLHNPRHPANIGFGLGMLSLAIIEAGDAIFLLSEGMLSYNLSLSIFESIFGSISGKRFSLLGEALLPSTWFLFSLTFARANYQEIISRWKAILIALFLGSLFFIFWIKSPVFIFQPYNAGLYEILVLGPIGKYFYIFFLLGMIVNLIHLENTLRSSTGSRRLQIKYVIIGVGSIFAFQIYLSSRALLFSIIETSYIPATSTVILISCFILLFAVIRHHLLEVDIFISRYVIYNSLTVFFVGSYLLIVGLVAQWIKHKGGVFDTFWSTLFIFSALLVIVGVSLSTRLRRKAQLFINRHFYKHKYEFRDKWMETTEKIGSINDLSKIQKVIVEIIAETMGTREVFLWLYEPADQGYLLVSSTITDITDLRFKRDHPLITYIKRYSTPFFIDETLNEVDKAHHEIASLITVTRAVLCTPLIFGGEELIGFILQGKDISGEQYRRDDFDLLKAISSHAASRIKNINLTQNLITAKEAETFHQVSSFFIHDLKNLVSTLSLLSQNAEEYMDNPSFQKDAMRTLRNTVSRMNSMISNLTILFKGLVINPQPVNLNDLLNETLSTLNGQIPSRIVKYLEGIPLIIADGEQMRKVFLNLLLNAIEASPSGGDIHVRTLEKDKEIILSVRDHGCGMSPEFIKSSLFRPFQTTKPNGLGIGLFQCKKIVEAHKGRIEVESREGEGSEFRVVLPAEMTRQR